MADLVSWGKELEDIKTIILEKTWIAKSYNVYYPISGKHFLTLTLLCLGIAPQPISNGINIRGLNQLGQF
ncbi:MAG: hypothetical protein R6U50_03985 [Desulfobacterales bacterium]